MAVEERQGFWKKYYLKEEERHERLTEGGDFFQNPQGMTLAFRARWDCASHPTFALIFFILWRCYTYLEMSNFEVMRRYLY
jgi:hypothetical protein